MPTRADMEAATPKCTVQQTNTEPRCGQMMRWDDKRNRWKCAKHGTVLLSSVLVARQAA